MDGILYLLFVVFLALGQGCGSPVLDCESAATSAFEYVSNGNKDRMAAALALPASLTPSEVDSERREFKKYLAFLLDEFGTPSVGSEVDDVVSFEEVSLGGGPEPYWWREAHPSYRDIVVAAEFRNVGDGLVRMSVINVDGRCAVAGIGFGLRSSRPGAADQIREISDRLYAFAGLPENHPLRSGQEEPSKRSRPTSP